FRVRGDTVEVCPAGREDGLRLEFFGDQIERLTRFDPLTGRALESLQAVTIYPGKQFVLPSEKLRPALLSIRAELGERIAEFEKQGKLLEAQRLKMRTEYDLEMMEEMGFCSGIENYSRHLSGRPLAGQIDDLINECRKRADAKERVLVTTLTKRTAEELTDYLREIGIQVQYLHSEIDAIERVEVLRALRKGEFDVLVGINLLREGLDLPEVSLVAILDADKEGFLRSETSLIQTAGRAARHLHGEVILYADVKTQSIQRFL